MVNRNSKKVRCPTCNKEVHDGNFCGACGAKLKEICDCWVLKKKYNCGHEKCKGYQLHIEILKEKGFS